MEQKEIVREVSKKLFTVANRLLGKHGNDAESITILSMSDSECRTRLIHEVQRQRREKEVKRWNTGKYWS